MTEYKVNKYLSLGGGPALLQRHFAHHQRQHHQHPGRWTCRSTNFPTIDAIRPVCALAGLTPWAASGSFDYRVVDGRRLPDQPGQHAAQPGRRYAGHGHHRPP
ncbi:MAG: hypothetical protein WKG07_16955 [Hymenobacter sp.]